MELGPRKHNKDGLMGPKSTMVVQMDAMVFFGTWTPMGLVFEGWSSWCAPILLIKAPMPCAKDHTAEGSPTSS